MKSITLKSIIFGQAARFENSVFIFTWLDYRQLFQVLSSTKVPNLVMESTNPGMSILCTLQWAHFLLVCPHTRGDTCKASENTDVSDIVSVSFFCSTLFFAQYITLQISNWVYQNYTSILLSELESHSSGIKLIFKIPIVCLTDQQCYRCWQNVSVEQIFPNKPHLPYTLEFFKRTTRIPNSSYIYLEWTQDV